MRTVLLALFVVAGCVEEPAASDGGPGRAPPPPGAVELASGAGVGALLPAQPATARVAGGATGSVVRLVRGTGAGRGPCPALLGGDCLGVVGAVLIGQATTDGQGVASFSFQTPTGPAPASYWFQAVVSDPGGAWMTAPLEVPAVPPASICDADGDGVEPSANAVFACEVLTRINDVRATGTDCGSTGVYPPTHPLTMNADLREASRVHVDWMADNLTLTHDSPGGPLGDTMGARATNAGYPWTRIAENIGRNQSTPDALVRHWLGSPPHCRNLMNGTYRDVGIAHVLAGNGTWYHAATFANRR